jgi:hypothetical protein
LPRSRGRQSLLLAVSCDPFLFELPKDHFMRSFKRLAGQLFSACAAALVLTSPAIGAKPDLPFNATIAIGEQVGADPTGTCPVSPSLKFALAGAIRGTGNASHLGKTDSTSFDCIQVAGPSSFYFDSTHLVLTAANGDQVFARYSGTLDATVPAKSIVVGKFEIIGGTGRFANAMGGGTLTGTENINSQTLAAEGRIELTGTISY